MKILDRQYVETNKKEILSAIKEGKIFIYPTDTIYGLGTNALLEDSVVKIREIKKRDSKPFSVIAPSKEWILENCKLEIENLEKYLPGPYTLIVETREGVVAPSVNPNGNTLGVRIPKHWFTDVVGEAGVPFVTTSVNIAGDKSMEKLEDVLKEILDQVDYVVYEGEKRGEPSEKINLL
ncbi:MAG: L-threonylcarbamoyladenylate synthase [Candidatus Colwellbacteria bacterium]|nr:L-threonylcarbamoyladenylate synthase [Candidatus Colwellbacteria bacterium]